MKAQNLLILFVASLFLFTSCAKLTYFTEDLYEQQGWSESELKKIQFYLSQDIVLKRELTGGKSEIISGKIKVENGNKIEEVIIPKRTPGTFVFSPKKDRFAIAFEEGDKRYLMFGPSPKYSDRFVMLASEWNRRSGKVTYDGKQWRVSSDDAYAALLVDLKKFNRFDKSSRTAKGRRIGD
ncbi:MAG: hypothetical protein AAFZ15_26740 [Bacteroidota bacterium]